jgi:hypothetical protein
VIRVGSHRHDFLQGGVQLLALMAMIAATSGFAGLDPRSAGAATGHGIQFVRDPLSFCIELHNGRREFRIRLRNNRGVKTPLTVSVENGRRIPFVLRSTPRVSVFQGAWNGRHHSSGCRATISWDHTQMVVTLPLAQE